MPAFVVKAIAMYGVIGTQYSLLMEWKHLMKTSFNKCMVLRQADIVMKTCYAQLTYMLHEDHVV